MTPIADDLWFLLDLWRMAVENFWLIVPVGLGILWLHEKLFQATEKYRDNPDSHNLEDSEGI